MQKQLEATRNLLLSDFSVFAQSLLDPNYYDDEFHTKLCNFLQKNERDKLVVLPRTFLKTTIISLYALWLATRDPKVRILITSNTTPNACKTVRYIRGIVENNSDYHLLFPDRVPDFSSVRWSDTCATLKRPEDYPEGTFEAAGVGSNIIRRHFNVIIEDDTVSPKKDELTGEEAMPSKEDIEKAVGFHKLTMPLLIDEKDYRIVVGTRWASYDLINYVKENETFAEYDKPCFKEDGTPRYKRFSIDRLKTIKQSMGEYMFSSLYLNQPLAKEHMAFNPDWTRYYEEDELPEEGDTVITIDPADPPTGKSNQDYTAIVSCKHTKKGIFIRRYRRKRLSDLGIIKEGMDVAELDEAVRIRIETNRYAHLEAGFREEMAKRNRHYNIDCVKAKAIAKEGRIKNRLSPLFENGVIFLKRGMSELEEELYTFPMGRHDDLIDALSWQIERYIPSEYERFESKKKEAKYNVFGLDTIRDSVQRARRPKQLYPFQVQNKN